MTHPIARTSARLYFCHVLNILALTLAQAAAYPWHEFLAPANVLNVALVIVGAGGVAAALVTLRSIRKQADLMAGQLGEMKSSREIETKTLVLQYRPRIVVRFVQADEFNWELGTRGVARIQLTLVNTGGSPAHITGGDISMCWAQTSPQPFSDKIIMHQGTESRIESSTTLRPGEQTVWNRSLDIGATNDLNWANYHAGLPPADDRALFLAGTVFYFDDLDTPRRTGIYRKYDPKTKDFRAADVEREYTD